MHNFKYDVSFRVFHPNINPDDICNRLNMQAHIKWRAGEQRKTPKGKALNGVYEQSYCSFKLSCAEDMGVAELLKSWNSTFLIAVDYLHQIHFSGGRLEYFIGWYSKENSGEVFDISLIEELAKLKIGIAIDFYGG